MCNNQKVAGIQILFQPHPKVKLGVAEFKGKKLKSVKKINETKRQILVKRSPAKSYQKIYIQLSSKGNENSKTSHGKVEKFLNKQNVYLVV